MPSFLSGLLWGAGQTLYMASTGLVGQSVCGPIACILAGCVAGLWSCLYFKEIRGRRGCALLALTTAVTLLGAATLAVSKTVDLN